MFKLKIQNVVFWLAAPTLLAKRYYNNEIDERISNLWRIHCNRVDKGNSYPLNPLGLGGTYEPSGLYRDKNQDQTFQI